jgi:hypothetical protein
VSRAAGRIFFRHKGLVSLLEEMDAAEHLYEADAIERPFLNGKVEFLDQC